MERLNISRSMLAERTGLSLKQVNNILAGITANPREETITRIAGVLGVQWRTLLEEHEGPPQETGEGSAAVQTTVDRFMETSNDWTPDELQRRLELEIKKLPPDRIQNADIVRIIFLRPKK